MRGDKLAEIRHALGYPERILTPSAGRAPEESVVEVEFVLLGDRIPILVPFLEDRIEHRAHDLAELLNLRAESREFLHQVFVGRRHRNLFTLLSRRGFIS